MKFLSTLLSTGVFMLFAFIAPAQKTYTISAKVVSIQAEPLPITARLLSPTDSSMIQGSLFENGLVSFSNITRPKVLLKLSALSFSDTLILVENNSEPHIDLGTIVMKEDNLILNEVSVKGQAPLVRHGKNGSLEISVSGTLLAASSSVIEILERSPNLSVNDGRITFLGRGEAIIFLNGRPITLEQLSAIPVSQILKLEILSNPSSKYDAEGKAVINIITKTNAGDGVRGTVTQQFSHSRFGGNETNSLADLNYVKNKLSLAGNYGLLSGNNREVLHTIRTRPAAADYLNSDLTTDWKRKYDNYSNLGLGVQYNINPSNNLSLDYKGNFDHLGGSQDSKNALLTQSDESLYNSHIAKNEKRKNHSLTLNYNGSLDSLGSSIFVGSQYTRYRTGIDDMITENNLVNGDSLSQMLKNNVAHFINISSTQTDYTKFLKNGTKMEAGLKFSYAGTSSETRFFAGTPEHGFEPDDDLSSNFRYTELLPAAYITYSGVSRNGIDYTVGMRGEWTKYRLNTSVGNDQFIKASYFNVFPNLLLSKTISNELKLRASYVSKITRPRYQALNPFVIYQDPFTTIEGNPNLIPEKIHAFEIGVNYKQFDLRAGYNYTIDPLSAAALRGSKPNSYVLKGINLEKDYTWTSSLSYIFNLSWWNSTNTATVNYSRSTDNHYDFVFVKPRPQVYLYTSNTFNIRDLFKIQVLAWYLGDRYYGLYYNKSRSTVTVGIEKSFIKNALVVRFTANDIFHQTNASGTYSVGQTDIFFNRSFSTNYFRLGLTFRFGKPGKTSYTNKSTADSENSRARTN
ncbi:outer membrane beta-barrel family protein [Dyadobacter diqingensis]|uniref:outer membrane beta-barrel family protein n=1 Tax=Dyadobacter diqingensis TaxID=2938121 RepID=UPI0020C1A50A|nr:outer membrane beta-barrel family protein [Dyadobacter diqingensis]